MIAEEHLTQAPMPIDTIEILRELVSIPSVNSMGRNDLSPVGEARLTEHLAAPAEGSGIVCPAAERSPRDEKTCWRGWMAIRRPSCGGGLILLDAHQDTVPADNMTIEPWSVPRCARAGSTAAGPATSKGVWPP